MTATKTASGLDFLRITSPELYQRFLDLEAAAGGGGSPPFDLVDGHTFTALGAAPGNYTLDNSGIVVKNDDGDEVFRIWGTDPDSNDFNAFNFYAGWRAGYAQPTNNVDAGYENTGVGAGSLVAIQTGNKNTAVGSGSLEAVTAGEFNTAIGARSAQSIVSGSYNTAIGGESLINATGTSNTAVGDFAGASLVTGDSNTLIGTDSDVSDNVSNSTVIGSEAAATASNRVVIGNDDVTDTYFGSESAASQIHAAGYSVGNTDGVDAIVGIPAVGTLTFTKGILTDFTPV